MEPLIATLTAYISQYFMIFVVWIGVAILVIRSRRGYLKVSHLTLTAILILFAESRVSVCVHIYSHFKLPNINRDYILSFFNGFTGTIVSVIQAVALSLLVAAIFSQMERA